MTSCRDDAANDSGRRWQTTHDEEGIRHFNKLVEAEKTECTVKGLQFDAFYCQKERERFKQEKKLDAQQFIWIKIVNV